MTLGLIVIHLSVYALLIDPLYHYVQIGNETVSTILHCLFISLLGSLICLLFFFFPEKRLVPMAYVLFAGLFAALVLITLVMKTDAKADLMKMLFLFGAPPVLVGNLTAWLFYRFRFCGKESFVS